MGRLGARINRSRVIDSCVTGRFFPALGATIRRPAVDAQRPFARTLWMPFHHIHCINGSDRAESSGSTSLGQQRTWLCSGSGLGFRPSVEMARPLAASLAAAPSPSLDAPLRMTTTDSRMSHQPTTTPHQNTGEPCGQRPDPGRSCGPRRPSSSCRSFSSSASGSRRPAST